MDHGSGDTVPQGRGGLAWYGFVHSIGDLQLAISGSREEAENSAWGAWWDVTLRSATRDAFPPAMPPSPKVLQPLKRESPAEDQS